MPRLGGFAPAAVRSPRIAWQADLDDHVIDLAYSPDGRWLAAAAVGGPIAVYEAATGVLHARLPGHAGGTFTISWRHDSSHLASGGQDGYLRIWDIVTGAAPKEAEAGAAWVERVAYAVDTDLLVSAAGRKLRLWNSAGQLLQSYPDHPSTISDVQWQPGERYFTSSCYGQVATFRADTAEPLKKFQWKGSILRLAWSPDANYIATGNQDSSVHFWYRKTGRDLEMSGYPVKVRELAWDPTSRFLATGGSAVVIVWDCSGKGPAGTRPIQLDGHALPVSTLAFQHRGSLLASGGKEGNVCVWNLKKEKLLAKTTLDGEVTQVHWAPNDRDLAVSSSRGVVRVLQPDEP
ncbi:MAG: WD40 repeat domain-containing protein [Bryobacterales bacterium]|nr:WD40 repeat domain-containing protein [Bryobacterales bacterium]